MDWLKLAVALTQLLGFFMKFLTDRQLLQAGGAEMIAAILKGQADDIIKGNAARQAASNSAKSDPSILHKNDGFRRD